MMVLEPKRKTVDNKNLLPIIVASFTGAIRGSGHFSKRIIQPLPRASLVSKYRTALAPGIVCHFKLSCFSTSHVQFDELGWN